MPIHNIYEVNLRQYTAEGTIRAFRQHLPRLKQMEVQTLWFMPLTPIAQLNKKGSMGSYYACADYYGVDPEFGTMQDFIDLVKEAHAMGFQVILDWVANHTGWDHVWTTEHPDWYEREADGSFKKASGMDDIIELDFTSKAMRKAMIAAMRWWVETTDIDGFRCDLAFWVEAGFWVEAKTALQKVKPLFWLAEADMWEHAEYMRSFDAAYTWKWMRLAEQVYHQQVKAPAVRKMLVHYQQLPGIKTWFTTNHDENSWNGTEYEKYGESALMLAVFSVLWPGIPLLYSGQEIPNTKRLAFFDKDPLDWAQPLELHGFYRALLHLQRVHPALQLDSPVHFIHTSADESLLCFRREWEGREVIVLLNLTNKAIRADVYDEKVKGIYTELFSEAQWSFHASRMITLPAFGYAVGVR